MVQVALCWSSGGGTSQLSHPGKHNRGHFYANKQLKTRGRDAAAVGDVATGRNPNSSILSCCLAEGGTGLDGRSCNVMPRSLPLEMKAKAASKSHACIPAASHDHCQMLAEEVMSECWQASTAGPLFSPWPSSHPSDERERRSSHFCLSFKVVEQHKLRKGPTRECMCCNVGWMTT